MQGYVLYSIVYDGRFSIIIVLLIIFVASNSSRYVVLSFKIYSCLHLYCYFEKKNKLAVHVVTTFVFVHP